MKASDRDQILFLEDMERAMLRVQEYISDLFFEDFEADNKTTDAVIRNFEIIGEAAKNVSADLKQRYPEVPWQEMYVLRNRVSHEYFGVDYEIIWRIANHYLPANLGDIQKIIAREKNLLI